MCTSTVLHGKHVNILAIHASVSNAHFHFVCIRNFQLRKMKCKIHVCECCLQYFRTEENLASHTILCQQQKAVRSIFPTGNDMYLEFKDYSKQQRLRFVAYCDVESCLKPISTCLPNDETSNTSTIDQNLPYACCILLVCSYNPRFAGADCMKKLVDKLDELTKWVVGIYSTIVLMKPKIPADEARLVAQKKFNYDAHFLIKPLAERHIMLHNGNVVIENPGKIQIPNGNDCNGKAQCFKLRFIDSFQFMSTSLETLAGNLLPAQLSISRPMFPDNTQLELAKLNRAFPYDFVKSPDSLMWKSHPPKDTFHNVMRDESISDDDYTHAQACAFNYINLLSMPFITYNFGTVCLAHYGLDPAMYVTAQSLSWGTLS
ncbi:hypothetical protein PR048_005667 [Dryococelus australis]|uniref:C2H2-type domain-containing protein n=1 Tax=Dryococelus australis TaxID=614101 RepID=A0ABQ9I8U3_9NEOP|nr:hypothetical protein PR048_005667 [Dryococelus australis]